MKYTAAASALLLAGVSAASNSTGVVYVTDVVTAFTTFCPAATSVVHNGVTYTVSEATTLTITNCPCTVTKPATSAAVSAAASSSAVVAPVYGNGTAAASGVAKSSGAAAGTGSSTKSASASAAAFTGGAATHGLSAGAGLAAIFGFAAYAL